MTDDTANEELRLYGMKALLSACSSAALQAPNMEAQIHIIIHGVLTNLIQIKEEALYIIKQHIERQPMESVESGPPQKTNMPLKQCSTTELTKASALENVRELFSSNNALQIRFSTSEILNFIQSYEDSTTEWASTILQIAAEWAPLNLRFHILTACLQNLEQCDATHWPTVRQRQLLYIVNGILMSRVNLIGLSTTDVLDSLLTIAQKVLQHSDSAALEVLQSHFCSSQTGLGSSMDPQAQYLQSISATIVAISAHSYYKNQIPDMLGSILVKTQSITTNYDLSIVVLKLLQLDSALQLITEHTPKDGPGQSRYNISISVFESSLPSLYNQPPVVRARYLDLLQCYFSRVPKLSEDQSIADGSRELTLRRLETSFYHSFRKYAESSADLKSLITLFATICGSLAQMEIIAFLPFVYRLDRDMSNSRELSTGPVVHKTPLGQILVAKIFIACGDSSYAAELLNMQQLPKLALILERLASNHQMHLSAEKKVAMQQTWLPETDQGGAARTVSLRHSSRSRLASSANASYENLETIGFASHDRLTTGRIDDLRKLLLQPKFTKSATSSQHGNPKIDLNDLFDGIELKGWRKEEHGSTEPQKPAGDSKDLFKSSPENVSAGVADEKEALGHLQRSAIEHKSILGPVIS